MTSEDELRNRLHRLADRAGRPSPDGSRLARRLAEEDTARRRRRRNVLVGVGSVIALGLAVPHLVGTDAREAVPASAPAFTPAPAFPDRATTPGAGLFDRPPRGSLADDRAFVEGVRALPWTEEPPVLAADGTVLYHLPTPTVEDRSVVFAGDVPDGRWAFVVGWTTVHPPEAVGAPGDVGQYDELAAAWFTGPPGATPAEMTPQDVPRGIATDWPVALTDPRTGALAVIAAPGDVVEVSARPEIDADGLTDREWRRVDTADGVAVTRVPALGRSYDASTSYRVFRDGRILARDMPWSVLRDAPAEPLAIRYPRGRPSPRGEQVARSAAEAVLAELGVSATEVEASAQWVGSVPATSPGLAAIVTVTLPSGAVVVEAQWLAGEGQAGPQGPDGSFLGFPCGRAVLPAGPPAERLVQAVACEAVDVASGAPASTSLVVVGPPEVTLIRIYDDDRNFLSEHTAVDGVLVAPLPLGADTVEAVTGAGVTLGRVELLGHAADFGD
jgi:hypothetical protein